METMRLGMTVMCLTLAGAIACASDGDDQADSAAVAGAPSTTASAPGAPPSGSAAPSTASGTASGTPSSSAPHPSSSAGAAGGTGGTGGSGASGATAATASSASASDISAATGVYTVAQANRGRDVYTNACARCHMTTQHSGATFASTWNNRRVFDLYDILYNTMPLDDPGSLSEQEYVDVTAYILQLNGHPAGKTALRPDPAALKKLRIDIRKATGL